MPDPTNPTPSAVPAGEGTGPPEEGGEEDEVGALVNVICGSHERAVQYLGHPSYADHETTARAILAAGYSRAAVPGPPEEPVEERGGGAVVGPDGLALLREWAQRSGVCPDLNTNAARRLLAQKVLEDVRPLPAPVEGRGLLYGQEWEVVDVENEDGTVWCSLRPLGPAAPAATEEERCDGLGTFYEGEHPVGQCPGCSACAAPAATAGGDADGVVRAGPDGTPGGRPPVPPPGRRFA